MLANHAQEIVNVFLEVVVLMGDVRLAVSENSVHQARTVLQENLVALIRNVRMVALKNLVHLAQTVLQENLVVLIRNVRMFALKNLVHLTQTVLQENAVMPTVLAPFIVIMVLLVGLSPSL